MTSNHEYLFNEVRITNWLLSILQNSMLSLETKSRILLNTVMRRLKMIVVIFGLKTRYLAQREKEAAFQRQNQGNRFSEIRRNLTDPKLLTHIL